MASKVIEAREVEVGDFLYVGDNAFVEVVNAIEQHSSGFPEVLLVGPQSEFLLRAGAQARVRVRVDV